MNCNDFHEQLALRLYDELDGPGAAALEAHLDECPACRAFSGELAGGLGRLVAVPRANLPDDWEARLRARVGEARTAPMPRHRTAVAALLGVAAGFLLAWVSGAMPASPRPGRASGTADRGRASLAVPRPVLRRRAPAPLALAGGDVARLRAYLRR